MTLISTTEAIADELTLYRLNGFDDVGGAGICNVLPSLLRRSGINEKLALAAIAGVGAEDGIGDHGRKAKEGVAACEKNNTAWQGLYRGLLQTVIKALNAEGTEPAHAESSFLDKLLAIGFCVFNFMQASFSDLYNGVFSSPLFKAWIIEINDGSNGERHDSICVPNDFFMGRYQRWSTL